MSKSKEKNVSQDEALFLALKKKKRRKRLTAIITVVVVLGILIAALVIGVPMLRERVNQTLNEQEAEVLSFEVRRDTISALVNGTGALESVDEEKVTLPAGVEIEEVVVLAGDVLKEGDTIARLKNASLMTVLSDTQKKLDDLDKDIRKAEKDTVGTYITTGVSGRVKLICAEPGESVIDCMTEKGALAVLSLDGLMSVEIDAEAEIGEKVTVETANNRYDGTVERCDEGKCLITLTDNGPLYEEHVTVYSESGTTLGEGSLAIHNPFAVTGIAGTVKNVLIRENQVLYAQASLFYLTDTKYSAHYDSLLQQRKETEDTLHDVIAMLHNGVLAAPFDGTVLSVEFDKDAPFDSTLKTDVITLAPNEKMSVTVPVDESNILSLSVGQKADVTVSSLGDKVFPGEVTEISRVGKESDGTTNYSAVVTVAKEEGMLSGMTAEVDIRIDDVENALIIPAEALRKTGAGAFVYTAFNELLREYDGRTDVTVGISNDDYVQILSGLRAGDTVYYTEKGADDPYAELRSAMEE